MCNLRSAKSNYIEKKMLLIISFCTTSYYICIITNKNGLYEENDILVCFFCVHGIR